MVVQTVISNRDGFTMIELIVVTLLLVLLTLFLMPATTLYSERAEKLELNMITHNFANEIRTLQEYSLLTNQGSNYRIIISNDMEGYHILQGTDIVKSKTFTIGDNPLWYVQSAVRSISFSAEGAPLNSGKMTFKHRQKNISSILEIEPVTGRITIDGH